MRKRGRGAHAIRASFNARSLAAVIRLTGTCGSSSSGSAH